MPNFQLIQELRNQYSSPSNIKSEVSRNDIDNIVKSFSSTAQLNEALKKGMNINPNIIDYLENQKEAHLVTIFIDICSFSTKVKDFNNKKLSVFLDNYYDTVIPIIYKHGGEVEKIIGDGIIAIFGQPFLSDNLSDLLDKADKCSKEILMKLEGTDSEVKIALHDGVIQYYKNKASKSTEYTIIGGVLTCLFRLESISVDNRLNYYCTSSYDNKFKDDSIYTYVGTIGVIVWKRSREIEVNLKGVAYKYVRNYKKKIERKVRDEYDIDKRVEVIAKLLNKDYPKIEAKSEFYKIHEQSTIFPGLILSVSLNKDFEQSLDIKALHLVFSEIIEVLNSSAECLKIEINNFTVQALYKGFYKYEFKYVYDDAMRITPLIEILNYKFNKIMGVNLKIGVGIDYGDIYVYNSPDLGTVYSGEVFEKSKALAKFGNLSYSDSTLMVSRMFYSNLIDACDRCKEAFQYNQNRNCYQSSWVNTALYDWYKEHCK